MTAKTRKKVFGCVAFQREQRDRISRKLMSMTAEEQTDHLRNAEIKSQAAEGNVGHFIPTDAGNSHALEGVASHGSGLASGRLTEVHPNV